MVGFRLRKQVVNISSVLARETKERRKARTEYERKPKFIKAGIVESIGKRDIVLCVIVIMLGMSFIICLNVLFFQEARPKFISRYYFVRPNTLNTEQLFNLTSHAKLIKLCKFVQEILNSLKL